MLGTARMALHYSQNDRCLSGPFLADGNAQRDDNQPLVAWQMNDPEANHGRKVRVESRDKNAWFC